jgi:hypothetical protein
MRALPGLELVAKTVMGEQQQKEQQQYDHHHRQQQQLLPMMGPWSS